MPYSQKKFRDVLDRKGRSMRSVSLALKLGHDTAHRLTKIGANINPTLGLLEELAREIGCDLTDFLDPIPKHGPIRAKSDLAK